MSVILPTWKVKIRRIMEQGQSKYVVHKTPFQLSTGCSGIHLSSQDTWEDKIRRIVVLDQLRPKKKKSI
jgi:hypothetical protein